MSLYPPNRFMTMGKGHTYFFIQDITIDPSDKSVHRQKIVLDNSLFSIHQLSIGKDGVTVGYSIRSPFRITNLVNQLVIARASASKKDAREYEIELGLHNMCIFTLGSDVALFTTKEVTMDVYPN